MLKLRKRTTPCVSTGKTCSASELYITDFRKVQLICLVFAFSFAEWFVVGFFFLFFFWFYFCAYDANGIISFLLSTAVLLLSPLISVLIHLFHVGPLKCLYLFSHSRPIKLGIIFSS